jgi:hypothetical protein
MQSVAKKSVPKEIRIACKTASVSCLVILSFLKGL